MTPGDMDVVLGSSSRILAALCDASGIMLDTLKGPNRSRCIARPRQLAYYLLRRHTKLSLPQIGALLRKDHTTVSHGIQMAERLLGTDPNTKNLHAKTIALLVKEAA